MLPEFLIFNNNRCFMFSTLLFALTFSIPSHVLVEVDTVPNRAAVVVGNRSQEATNEVRRVFRDHYYPGNYPPFEGTISQIGPRAYRLDSFTMRIDSVPDGMTGLLSRGLLFPGRLAPWCGSTDTVLIKNLHELKELSPSPQIKRFSCWIYNSGFSNPVWYVFELTNDQGSAGMDMAAFIQDARLTFLYQVSVII